MEDLQLLTAYTQRGSQEAFASLVERYLDFVYSLCLRELRDPVWAEDVTQVVFLLLAQKAPHFRAGTVLAGWLFNTARFACKSALRQEMRRIKREQKVAIDMVTEQESCQAGAAFRGLSNLAGAGNTGWEEIELLLDEALAILSTGERDALLLRYFQNKSLRETGVALGIAEAAAGKRISRALSKLRHYFKKHGFAVSAVVLATSMSEHAVQAAPASCKTPVMQIGWSVPPGAILAHILLPNSVASGAATELSPVPLITTKVLSTFQATVKSMFVAQLKLGLGLGLTLTVVADSGNGLLHLSAASEQTLHAPAYKPLPSHVVSPILFPSHHNLLNPKVFLSKSGYPAHLRARHQETTPSRLKPVSLPAQHNIKLISSVLDQSGRSYLNTVITNVETQTETQTKIQTHPPHQAQKLAFATPQEGIMGVVLDVAGHPVAGATVMSPNGDPKAQVISDAAGKFVLPYLHNEDAPTDDMMVLAGYKNLLAEARNVNSRPKAELALTLLPIKPQLSNDIERAYNLLEDLWASSLQAESYPRKAPAEPGWATALAIANREYYRNRIPATLAPYDPDRAIQLAAHKDGSIDEGALMSIITALAKANPRLAAAWAPPRLKQVKNRGSLFSLQLTLASSCAKINPELARELYEQAKIYDQEQAVRNPKNPQSRATQAIALGRVAKKLGRPDEAAQFAQTALAAARQLPDLRWLLSSLAVLTPEATEEIIDTLPEAVQEQILQETIQACALEDAGLARHLLQKLIALEKQRAPEPRQDKESGYSTWAAVTLIKAIGQEDPIGALEVARQIEGTSGKPYTLALAAQFQPREAALQLLPEAFNMVMAQPYPSVAIMAHIAAIAYNIDPALGEKLFAQTRDRWLEMKAQPQNQTWVVQAVDDGTPAFAFYYSRVAPAESRLILETEFALQRREARHYAKDLPVQDQPLEKLKFNASRRWLMHSLALAMVAIDVERAEEMASLLPPPETPTPGMDLRIDTYCSLTRYILLSDRDRKTKQFDMWD